MAFQVSTTPAADLQEAFRSAPALEPVLGRTLVSVRLPPGSDSVARQGLFARLAMVDDRTGVVAADTAAGLLLDLFGHRPRLGEVLIGHAGQLGDIAPDVVAGRVKALLLEGRVEHPLKGGRGIDPDRGDPLPVAVVGGLITVDQVAHEPALAPAPVDAEVLGEKRADDQAGTVVHPALATQLAHAGVDARVSRAALAPGVEALLGMAPADRPAVALLELRPRVGGKVPEHVGVEVAPAELAVKGRRAGAGRQALFDLSR